MSEQKRRERVPIDLDPSVARTLAAPPRTRARDDGWVKITVRIPRDLRDRIRQEAFSLTHHRRRGFQDLVVIFLRYALRAYENGDLEVAVGPKVVEYRIMEK